ncbi:MAG: fibronectin/fibrinogen-binding protein [Clostridiales bacterium]|nr:MAG: fibronectin/fibrinogen-binding protein [Clostridiales bacterium]
MALDGIMTYALCCEFKKTLLGGKVEKITQPEKDDIVLHFHTPGAEIKNSKLILSANPSNSRACLTAAQFENPLVPPNFCMLLRKHLGGAKLLNVTQPGFERVLIFTFECRTEMRESVEKHLILEIMGKWSNLVLTDFENKVIDALRPVDFSVSEKRQLFAGLTYELPPSQNKLDISAQTEISLPKGARLDTFLTSSFTGFSPLLSRELSYELTGKTDSENCDELVLNKKLQNLYRNILEEKFTYCVLFTDKPLEFYCFDINQYGEFAEKKYYTTPSEALEEFYSERRKREHLKRGAADITKLLSTLISRVSRKINAQLLDIEECKKSEKYRRIGDIITANIYMLKKGDGNVMLQDYYSDGEPVQVSLDKRLTPSENAQRYYKLYKKATTAKEVLSKQLPLAKTELKYLESVLASVDTAENLVDISQIREELSNGGYIKKQQKDRKIKQSCVPSEYRSSDGFTILVGKNNAQNDFLTLKMAEKQDIWFHVKNYPGSHVIVVCEGKTPPNSTLTQAAIIAATNSKIRDGKNVEVDYTEVKNIKKPSGSKPGMVVYETYKTAIVTPSEELINELIVKK